MKSVVAKLPARYTKKAVKQESILSYDTDNAYPQRMELLVNSSGALFRCVETMAKFIAGHGYSDPNIGNLVINRHGWTYNQLAAKRAKDRSKSGGWAIHVNYNALYQEIELQFIPFKYCRIAIDKDENPTGQIAVYDDWGNWQRSRVKKDKISLIHMYNPNPEVIEAQVQAAGGWEKYKGQIIWYSPEIDTYPLAPFDSEAESAEADFRIKRFKLKNISTSFMASYMYIIKGQLTDDEFDDKVKEIEEFMGDENAGNVFVVNAERDEAVPELKKFDLQDMDKMFAATATDTYERIRKVFSIPPVLVGDLVGGKMGTAREFMDAVNMYNNHTQNYRDELQDIDKRILAHWHVQVNGEFEIKPLSSFTPVDIPAAILSKMSDNEQRALVGLAPNEDTAANEQVLAVTLGVGGTQAYIAVITNKDLTPVQKVQNLMGLFSLTEEKANLAVYGTPTAPTPNE